MSDNSEIDKNIMILGAVRSSSMYIDNKNKDILMLGKGQTGRLDDTVLTEDKEI